MNKFLAVAISLGVFCLVGLAVRVKITLANRKFRELTKDTEVFLYEVSKLLEPIPANISCASLPIVDVVSIYLNSRGNRGWVNERRLDGNIPECALLLSRIETKHGEIKNLAISCIGDRILDKITPGCPSMRCRLLLWTYAYEQEVLSSLSPFCSASDINFITSRV